MNESQTKTAADFVLPPSVVSKVDLSRLVNEVEKIDDELTTASVRAGVGASMQVAPSVSEGLLAFLQQNHLNLNDSKQRGAIVRLLHQLKDTAPIIHMTFAVEADRESLMQLAQWLRTTVHPQAVIAVGLQPGLIAGVYLRTPNHVHDMSLRHLLDGGHDVLVQDLEALRAGN